MLKQRVNPTNLLLTFWLLLMCVSAQAAINVSIEANPDPVAQSEVVRTAITVGNTGNSVSGTLTLQLRYPDHLNDIFNSVISNGGACPGNSRCSSTEFLTWTLGNLAPGASITVTLPPSVNSGTPDGTLISFDAVVFEDGGNVAMASRSIVVQSASIYDIAVDEDLNPVAPNQSLTYAITYANRSALSTTNTQLNFSLPTGVSFVSASGGGILNGSIVEWDLQTFPARKGGRQTVTVNVNPGVTPGTLLEVDAATITGQANFLNHSARAVATTRVDNNVPLALTVELNPDPVQPGESLQSALTVGNTSSSTLFGVTLQLRYPDHLNDIFNSVISNGGTCPGNSRCSSTEFLTWTLGNLAPGASITVTLPPSVNSGTPDGTLISFDAVVFEDGGNVAMASRSIVVQSASIYDIAVDEDLNPVAPNQSLTYAITYANRSALSTTNTQLNFSLPTGVSFVSASGGGILNGSIVEWDLQTFPARKGGRQTVTVNVNPGVTPGTLLEVDAATITGQANFLNHSARAVATTRVDNNVPLALTVELNPDPVQPGESLQSALTVGNTSSSTLFGVTLQLRYPDHLNDIFNSVISNGGTCPGNSRCSSTEFLTWTLGNLAPGASITVTLPPSVNSGTPDGTLISFDAVVFEDGGRRASASRTALVSEFDFVSPPKIPPIISPPPITPPIVTPPPVTPPIVTPPPVTPPPVTPPIVTPPPVTPPIVTPPPVTLPPVTPPPALISDVDGNGQSDALTDGLLILRFLFGITGPALTEGAIGAGSNKNFTDIIDFLTTNSTALDVDGNGSSDALTDGLLIIRYIFGLRGNSPDIRRNKS